MTSRLMIPPAPVERLGPDRVKLDVKFVVGMENTCANWPGHIDCVLREGVDNIPFGREYRLKDLPFDIKVLPKDALVSVEEIKDYDIVELSGDMHYDYHLAEALAETNAKTVYVVEYDLKTRLQIVWLQSQHTMNKKLRSTVWTLLQERKRRRAFANADALQINGYPAYHSYARLNRNTLLYLDNRMHKGLLADDVNLTDRKARLRQGAPLRLINAGRLEPMKGAQDLVPLAKTLMDKGVSFTLDVYGTGSLEESIRAGIEQHGLSDHVTLHAPVDFETELVPLFKDHADIFLSCHRQSDPSCSYLEAMGCGLPVVGYSNSMLSRLLDESDAGWCVRLGDVSALAHRISVLAANLDDIDRARDAALAFARTHDFECEFQRRHDHFLSLAER